MRKLLATFLVTLLLFSTASAEGFGDFLGGLSSLFSSNNEATYGVGDEAAVDDLIFKLTDVMTSKGNSYYKPDTGMEYVILQFTITNNGTDNALLSTIMNFTFWCDDTIHTIDLEALATGMLSGKYQLDCAVESGKKVTGIIGYEVPSDWKTLKVECRKEVYFGDTVTFLVERNK